jgi:oligopeptide transport system substrate-binding protein
MYRNLLGLLAVFAVALLLVSITFSSVKEERADYVFVNGTEPKSLDPQIFTGQPEGRIGDALFEGLTYRNNETLKPDPGSADRWEVSPDGRDWTFHIRPEARWTNGDPVTARDFVYAWVRLQEPEIAAEYAYLMHMVVHAEAYNTYGAQVTALRGDPDASGEAKEGIVKGLEALVGKHASGLPAKELQSFADDRGLRDAVTRTSDAALLAALAKTSGELTPDEGKALVAAVAGEADRRDAALRAAKEHFGKDEGVWAPNDATLRVRLRAYTPYFLELTAFYPTYPVHRKTVETWKDSWFREGRIVSNGPFRLEAWRVNEKIRLRKNPTYWGASQVHLETVDVLPINDRTTAFNLYMTGGADWLPTMYPVDLIDKLKGRPDFYGSAGLATYFYRFNCTKKPFDDVRVRKALGMAFDRRVIVEKLTRKGEIPCSTIVPPGIDGYEPPEGVLTYDPEGARRLLAEAGFPGGRGFPPFAIIYNTDEGHKKIAEFIANQWRENLGIQASAANKEWQAILEDVRRLNFEVERAGWVGDYADPNTFLDMWLTKGGNNQTGWGDPFYDRLIALAADPVALAEMAPEKVDALAARLKEPDRLRERIAAVRGASDREARLAAAARLRFHVFREAEAILCRDALPILPIYFYFYSGIVAPEVEGFHGTLHVDGKELPDLQDLHPFRDVRMRPRGDRAR